MNKNIYLTLAGLIMSVAAGASQPDPVITAMNFQHIGDKEQVCVTYYNKRECSEPYKKGDPLALKVYNIWKANGKELRHKWLGEKFTLHKLHQHILADDDQLAMSERPCEAKSAIIEQVQTRAESGKLSYSRQMKFSDFKFPNSTDINEKVSLVDAGQNGQISEYSVRAKHKRIEGQTVDISTTAPAGQYEGSIPAGTVLRVTNMKNNEIVDTYTCKLAIPEPDLLKSDSTPEVTDAPAEAVR